MSIISSATNYVRGLFGGAAQKSQHLAQLARTNAAAMALSFFEGLAPRQLKVKPGELDDNVHINYAQVIVDKGVAFLFGEPLRITTGDEQADAYLESVWAQAQRDEEFEDMATDGGIHGDCYLKLNVEPDGKLSVTWGDPANWTIEPDPHNVNRAQGFVCQYECADASTGKTYLFRETTRRDESGKTWTIAQAHSYDGGKSWSPVGQDVTWNLSTPPVFHCKNLPNSKNVYGRPDLTPDVLKVINYISRLDSLCGKVVRVHSSPKPYAKGLSKRDIEWGTDGMLFLNPEGKTVEAEIGLLEMTNDIATALSLRKVLREGLAEMTGVPEVATGKVESTGQLSSLALRILFSPLLDKTKKKRRRYGRMITECATAILELGNFAGAKVMLHWGDPLPVDKREAVEVAEAKKRIGYSEETVISELGGDPKQERERRKLDVTSTAGALLGAFDKGIDAEEILA